MMELSLLMLCEKGLSTIARLEDGRRPPVEECGRPLRGGKGFFKAVWLDTLFLAHSGHLELLTMRNVR